jgi:glycosyltransferase involved in cell wall biosynthesis
VSFEGFQANPFAFMRAADVFVLSSEFEGFGNVIVEAMAVGTPVVATDCPYGPEEILDGGRYGCLVPPGDPQALADALARVLADPALRARMSAAGRERARAFSSQAIADEYAALFERVLPEGAPAAATVSPVLTRVPRAASAAAAPAPATIPGAIR